WFVMFLERHLLENMAFQDSITRLPNRNAMNRFFDNYLGDEQIGVMYIDLDHFKIVNDTLGHDMGDLLVHKVGIRLRRFIQKDQQVFRIGGDEFLLIVKQCDEKRAKQLAKGVLQQLTEIFYIHGNELFVTASIGISIGCLRSERS